MLVKDVIEVIAEEERPNDNTSVLINQVSAAPVIKTPHGNPIKEQLHIPGFNPK